MGSQGRVLIAQFLRFNLVGVLTVIIGMVVFAGMIVIGINYVAALVGDYAAGSVFSYFANKQFTFKAKVESNVKPLLLTALTYSITFMLNLLLLAIAVDHYQLDVLISQVVILIILAFLNFSMFKLVVFRGSG